MFSGLVPGLQAEYFNFKQGAKIPDLNGRVPHAYSIESNVNPVVLPSRIHPEHLAVRWTGKINIDQPGKYMLSTVTPGVYNSAATLSINRDLVVKHDVSLGECAAASTGACLENGQEDDDCCARQGEAECAAGFTGGLIDAECCDHGQDNACLQTCCRSSLLSKTVGMVQLQSGLHDFEVVWSKHTRDQDLQVLWKPPNSTETIIPAGQFVHNSTVKQIAAPTNFSPTQRCRFPFAYHGNVYNSCTVLGSDSFWCR